jgi:transcriptional regulator of acetoin/glycerol metabolism
LREDLVYRLNGLTLRVPSLRERTDLTALARAIVSHEAPGRPLQLADEVIELLRQHRWPGNLRQLCNVLRAAVALAAQGDEVTREHLSVDIVEDVIAPVTAQAPPSAAGKPALSLDELTLEAIAHAVDAAHGNISEASRHLGISRNTIYRKLRWKK